MPLYLATTPDRLAQCRSYTPYLAHVAYRIGEDGTLQAQPMPLSLRGGLMVLRNTCCHPLPDPDALCRQLLQICLQRKFAGIVLDEERSSSADSRALAARLEKILAPYQRRLMVPLHYAGCVEKAAMVVCTALSGGSLQQMLRHTVEQYGAGRLVLDLQRVAMAFPLPCPSGEGQPLTMTELQSAMTGRAIFFSEELCARYFTVHRGGRTQFILFDDADTLRRKWQVGQQLGISDALVMLPETEDLLEDLFREKERS